MPGSRSSTSLRGRQSDLIYLAILLFAAPILWFSDQRFGDLSPDGVAYLTLAKSLLRDGRLYLESWGHIDEGLILPPLYPALIAGSTPFFSDSIEAALTLSLVCSALTLVVLFLLIRDVAGRQVAVVACLAIAWNTVFIEQAFSVLTEALFIFATSCALLALAGAVTRKSVGLAFLCGVLGGLAFLARQVGLVVPVFCVLWALLAELRSRPLRSPLRISCPLFILLGSALVIGPYAGVLWAETGQHLLQRVGRASLNPLGGAGVQPMPRWQRFRMERYVVETNDARVLEEIERFRRAG